MTRCTRAISKDCDDRDLAEVVLFMRRTPRLVCGACRSYMTANGISFTVERRAEARPRWLSNLRAVDRTGELVA